MTSHTSNNPVLNWLLATPDDLSPEMARLYVIEKTGLPFGLIMHMFYVPIFWHLDISVLVLFNVASVLLWSTIYWFFRLKGEQTWTYILGVLVEIPLHGVIATHYVGFESAFLL